MSLETHPRSPHMAPPFCAVGHSECSLQSFVNFSDLKAISSGFLPLCFALNDLASSLSSLMIFLIKISASGFVRGAFLTTASGALAAASWYLTRMCRRRALLMSVPVFCFFLAGPSSLGFSAPTSSAIPRCPPWRSHTSTAVHCAVGSARSTALVTISPTAARGWFGKAIAISTSSSSVITSATGLLLRRKNFCLSAHDSFVD
mmetsp:Transcript_78845/g.189232  ORF Transcript_78845/g.189232 Transcript_78845/m.189232 type:complete len:203 (-) Transcript_78845:803-1411(-)